METAESKARKNTQVEYSFNWCILDHGSIISRSSNSTVKVRQTNGRDGLIASYAERYVVRVLLSGARSDVYDVDVVVVFVQTPYRVSRSTVVCYSNRTSRNPITRRTVVITRDPRLRLAQALTRCGGRGRELYAKRDRSRAAGRRGVLPLVRFLPLSSSNRFGKKKKNENFKLAHVTFIRLFRHVCFVFVFTCSMFFYLFNFLIFIKPLLLPFRLFLHFRLSRI